MTLFNKLFKLRIFAKSGHSDKNADLELGKCLPNGIKVVDTAIKDFHSQ
jgi:hypothetical protein